MWLLLIFVLRVVEELRDWDDLAEWQPTDGDQVMNVARRIRERFIDSCEAELCLREDGDHVYGHAILFLRDALLHRVFQHAVRHGDPGLVLRVIKYWLYSFRGAGMTNYARESMEVLVQWESGELDNAMKDALERTWFYNRWGDPTRFIASDLHLEHLNYYLKVRIHIRVLGPT
jgi:hypothetical protein